MVLDYQMQRAPWSPLKAFCIPPVLRVAVNSAAREKASGIGLGTHRSIRATQRRSPAALHSHSRD